MSNLTPGEMLVFSMIVLKAAASIAYLCQGGYGYAVLWLGFLIADVGVLMMGRGL